MPPISNGDTRDAGTSGPHHKLPRGAVELRDRAHQYLAKVGPALDSIESVLESWGRFSDVAASPTAGAANRGFRSVQMDSFTVRQPPPSVSEAEITQHIQRLSKADRKALDDEYELTCVDEFEYVHSGEDALETASAVAARIVHFSNEAADTAVDSASVEGDVRDGPVQQALPSSESPTTRARTLFEGDDTSLEQLGLNAAGRITYVRAERAVSATSQTPPAFSLEQMSPSAGAAHDRRRSASSDSSRSIGLARSPTATGLTPRDSCTVEINYSADHFFPSTVQRALRDGAGSAITIKPSTQPMPRQDTVAGVTQHAEFIPTLISDSDEEGAAAEADIQSFTTFSRMVLANEGRRLTSQRAHVEAPTFVKADTRPASVAPPERQHTMAEATPPPPPPTRAIKSVPAATTTAAVAKTVPVAAANTAGSMSARDAFVRKRVHDVLLANRVRAADTAALGAAFFERLDETWSVAASETTPVLHELDRLLCESSALLHTLEVMDHQAYRERVMDPSQYLCVPRYSVACAAPDCTTAFSATTTRVMCGRCGQSFCPACCVERGLGPDVLCEGQHYSLGWEPLCRICFQMCRDSQQKLVQERHQLPRITDAAARAAEPLDDAAAEEAARRASLDSLTLKQAVLFGAYCDEQRCLSDGLPPFYVMDSSANEGVNLTDKLWYQLAKSRGTLRRGWQSAGNVATHAVQSAAQIVSNRRVALR